MVSDARSSSLLQARSTSLECTWQAAPHWQVQQQMPKAMQLPLQHSHHVLLQQQQLQQASTAAGRQAADHQQLGLAQQQQLLQRVAVQSSGHPSALMSLRYCTQASQLCCMVLLLPTQRLHTARSSCSSCSACRKRRQTLPCDRS
jgi:hypothetical protein